MLKLVFAGALFRPQLKPVLVGHTMVSVDLNPVLREIWDLFSRLGSAEISLWEGVHVVPYTDFKGYSANRQARYQSDIDCSAGVTGRAEASQGM